MNKRDKSRLWGRRKTPGAPLNLDGIMSGDVGLWGWGVVSKHITVSSLCMNLLTLSKILLFSLFTQARGWFCRKESYCHVYGLTVDGVWIGNRMYYVLRYQDINLAIQYFRILSNFSYLFKEVTNLWQNPISWRDRVFIQDLLVLDRLPTMANGCCLPAT